MAYYSKTATWSGHKKNATSKVNYTMESGDGYASDSIRACPLPFAEAGSVVDSGFPYRSATCVPPRLIGTTFTFSLAGFEIG
jgi:hypothetical protein